jgi:hypothetical protein
MALAVMVAVGTFQSVSKHLSSSLSGVSSAFGLSTDAFYSQDFTAGTAEPMQLSGVSAPANELLVLFVGSDCFTGGPDYCGQTVSNISDTSGGSLNWQPVAQAHGQDGVAEIWYAIASAPVTNISISVNRTSANVPQWGAKCYGWASSPPGPASYWGYTLANPDCNGMVVVQTFSNYDTTTPLAAATTASGNGAIESASVSATKAKSQIWGVGYDYQHAATRITPQDLVHEDISNPDFDTAWVQNANTVTNSPGTYVLTDTGPGAGPWDYAAVEVRAA